MSMANFDWNSARLVVTCGGGLEDFLLQEIQTLAGQEYKVLRGAVEGPASAHGLYNICLWSRLASRVLLPLAHFPYKNEQDLYDQMRTIQWHDHFDNVHSIAISTSADSSVSLNTQFLTLKTKDAIMDHFRHFTGDRPGVNTRDPDIRIHVHFDRELVSVSLDLSGEPLHKRGYRVAQNDAPMKETLAAALLIAAGWPDQSKTQLIDPMCGSGTLLIEAAMMQAKMAPGLLRRRFGFECWRYHEEQLWQQMISEAALQDQSEQITFSIKGYDADPNAIQAAGRNIKSAGLEGCIHLERRELALFHVHEKAAAAGGFVVCNPPYGERLDKDSDLIWLYRAIARALQKNCADWRVALITNQIEFADVLQLDDPQTYRVFNGPIRCFVRSGKVVPRSAIFQPVPLQLRNETAPTEMAADFANRLKKNYRQLVKWAEREQVYAWRLYDADIPEYNLAVDWYNGHLHVQEYAPPKTVDPDKAAKRLDDALAALRQVFDVAASRIHLKSRQRQKGKQQYQKLDDKKRMFVVEEGGAQLLVNLDDYLDTGLFLDHRPTRLRLQQLAQGKRFLNLFCYTGAATVHAAYGGAKKTVSVDMSTTYLEWARNNLYLNGFAEASHQLIRSDCMKWLKETNDQFDLIFVDPPTFSNSKRMQGFFDVQAAHEEMLDLVMKRLEPGGLVIFSNNFRGFKLAEGLETKYQVKDITQASLPPDFASKGRPIHRCWELALKPKTGVYG